MKNPASSPSELSAAIWSMRRIFYVTGAFSFCINLLLLVPALYMLQIYDRVLTSRNELTLWMLTFIMLGLYLLMGAMEGCVRGCWSGPGPGSTPRSTSACSRRRSRAI